MSTRWYPLYQRGNPQLRVFLPNFWIKVVKPKEKIPPNIVQFHVSNEMTEYDVRNYLTKIYKLPVVAVKVEMKNGNVARSVRQCIIKEDDYKVAFVTMEKSFSFTFPDMPLEPGLATFQQSQDEGKQTTEKFEKKHSYRPGIPTWFGP